MRRLNSALVWVAVLALVCALTSSRAFAQPTISNPVVLATNVNGTETGTTNTQFIFRATVTPSANQGLIANSIQAVIDPADPANPEFGGRMNVRMVGKGNNVYVCYVLGRDIGTNNGQPHYWSIRAQDTGTGGTPVGWAAAPKPASRTLLVVSPQGLGMVPVYGPNPPAGGTPWGPDKRTNRGQWGNGLEVNPTDSTSPNDGGSAHFYTWRVRVSAADGSGLVPQFFMSRGAYEWHDWRFDNPFAPPVTLWNSPVVLALVDPAGTTHYCPMEIDPEAPGNPTYSGVYTVDSNGLTHPVAGSFGGNGIVFRYRMVPAQYMFNWGALPGEGPFTSFGGPTQPDKITAIPIGYDMAAETTGRPTANQYTGWAGNDRNGLPMSVAPPFPYYTNNAGRAGQWRYYYMATSDLRPPTRTGFNTNGSIDTYPYDIPGADPQAYLTEIDSDNGLPPYFPIPNGSAATAYLHPYVSPILSDGGWTDDLPENGYTNAQYSQSHRSRLTNKTKVRFMCRVTKDNQTPLPAQAVRVWIDGVVHTMEREPNPGNTDYTQGIIYYYDTTFVAGQEGHHWTYFEVDDGIHKAIWPRRDTAVNGTGDARFYDTQAPKLTQGVLGNYVAFGTQQVGYNYLDEPLVNHKPALSGPSVTPTSGVEAQPYTYQVTYTDADNDEPLDAWVYIDGQPHRMTPADTTPTRNGRIYRFTMTQLVPSADGTHTYYFKFRDNWNTLTAYGVTAIRREFGEWSTLPTGDDNGVPSSVITGPIIVGNKRPQLMDPAVFPGDQAQTPATLWDFVVRYKDQDNDPPQYIKLFLSNNDGASWDGGTTLVKAENSSNYTAGVQYHLSTRIRLPYDAAFKYRYKFVASDGSNHVDNFDSSVESTRIHVGTGVDALGTGTARTLAAVGGTNTIYADPAGTKNWYSSADPTQMTQNYYVWRINGTTGTTLLTWSTDFTIDPVAGQLTLVQPNVTGDTIKISYYYTDTVGPIVNPNHAPVLTATGTDPQDNYQTLVPLQGGPSTQFTYTIVYTDPDNQAPAYVNVLTDTQTTHAMTMDPATTLPADFTRGVKYLVTLTGSQIGNGAHNYHFEASDGSDVARFPLGSAPQTELVGPSISNIGDLNLPPTGSFNDNPIVPFPKGKSTDNYIFTVVYKNSQGLAPVFPIELRVKASTGTGTTAVTMQPIDPIGPTEYQNGVRYQTKLTAPADPLSPGSHEITFGFAGQPAGTVPKTLIVNGPPVLSGPVADPNPATQAGDIAFKVLYQDLNGDPPQPIHLYIDGKVSTVTPTTTPVSPTAADFKSGVIYTWSYQAKDLTVGTHTYWFTAQDDLEAAPQVPQAPGGSFTIAQAGLPELLEIDGSANGGTLTPLTGAKSSQFTYSVKYRHADGAMPVSIQVVIDASGTTPLTRTLTPVGGTPTADQIKAGVIYSYQTQVGELAAGSHTYHFTASDRLASVRLPAAGEYTGPTVNNPPALSAGTVYPVGATTKSTVGANNQLSPAVNGTILTKFVFEVVYTDADFQVGVSPQPTVTVKINNAQTLTLTPQGTAPFDYSKGVTFTSDAAGIALTAGQKNFHFEATDTLDSATFPAATNTDISGLTVYNIPTLVAVNATGDDGTLSPRQGPVSSVYTYQIVYKHADNTAPAYVRVVIDGTSHDMTKSASSTNYAAGVTYQFQMRFPANAVSAHTYYFVSQDGVSPSYTAYYPSTAPTTPASGPALNVATFSNVVFTPNPGIVGAPVTVTGTLAPAIADARGVAIQLVRPDGTGYNDSVVTDTSGNFTYTFTPTQTGDWKIRLSWGGVTGVWDPVTQEFPAGGPYTVKGYSVTVTGTGYDLVSTPMVPVTPDPGTSFGPTLSSDGSAIPVTQLNLVQWSAGQGRYLYLNSDPTFPGVTGGAGYWMKPTSPAIMPGVDPKTVTPITVTLNPRGKLWDQTQQYEVPLQPGWNMIGSVYLSDINWAAVQVHYGGQYIPLAQAANVVRAVAWGYNPNTGSYQTVTSGGTLKTGRGYWVKALDTCALVLPPPGRSSVIIGRDAIDKTDAIQVVARTGNRSDTDNYVPTAGFTKDQLSLVEKPPYVGDYVTVRFVDPGTVQLPADTRAAQAKTVVVFDVVTDHANSDVTVEFPNAGLLSRHTEAVVVDLSTNNRRALGTNGGLTYNTGDNAKPRRFALLLNDVTRSSRFMITGLRSSGRAQGATSFTFDVTASATIHAEILGTTGQVVRDLAQGRSVTRGTNSLLWDGKDSRGIAVPVGTYMLKVTGTDGDGRAASAVLPVTIVR